LPLAEGRHSKTAARLIQQRSASKRICTPAAQLLVVRTSGR